MTPQVRGGVVDNLGVFDLELISIILDRCVYRKGRCVYEKGRCTYREPFLSPTGSYTSLKDAIIRAHECSGSRIIT